MKQGRRVQASPVHGRCQPQSGTWRASTQSAAVKAPTREWEAMEENRGPREAFGAQGAAAAPQEGECRPPRRCPAAYGGGGAASTHVLAALTAREARPFRSRCCFALAPVVLRAGRAPRRSESSDHVGTWRWAGKQGRVPGCEEPPRGRSPREKPRVCPERTCYWGERIKRSRQGNRDELVRGVPGKRRRPVSEAPGVDAWKTPP